jgi:peptide/nickel transport system ATP-binding protein
LCVDKGERIGLVGETGCGKTITIKTVLGLLKTPPASIPFGEIFLFGRDILKISSKEFLEMKGVKISMIFQDPRNSLNPVFTIGEQLRDVIRFAQRGPGNGTKLSNKAIKDKAVSALKEVGLPDPERIMNNYPLELSGGMCQRVLIAMAIVNEPALLLADEPGTALDVTIQAQILELINKLVRTRGISILLISHNLGVIREITERIYVMYAGQVAETAPTADFFKNPQHPYSQGLLASIPRLTGGSIAEGIPGIVPDYTIAPSGCRFHPRCNYSMSVCSQKKPELYKIKANHYVACHLYSNLSCHDE